MLAQEDSVRILHAGEAMRYEYHGFSLTCLQHRFVHIPFRDGVQRTGGFVQNDDVAIPGVDAGDGQKLLLAHGEVCSVRGKFAGKRRVDSPGQLTDRFPQPNLFKGLLHTERVAGRAAPAQHIVGNGYRQQRMLLQYDGEAFPVLSGVISPDIRSTHIHAAGLYIVKPQKELDQRGFARAVFAHQRDFFSLAYVQIHIVNDVGFGSVIGEAGV